MYIPSYREQNYIDWNMNERLCREAVAKYKRRWSTREGVDVSAFNEWECKLNECIQRKIASLRKKEACPEIKEAFGVPQIIAWKICTSSRR